MAIIMVISALMFNACLLSVIVAGISSDKFNDWFLCNEKKINVISGTLTFFFLLQHIEITFVYV